MRGWRVYMIQHSYIFFYKFATCYVPMFSSTTNFSPFFFQKTKQDRPFRLCAEMKDSPDDKEQHTSASTFGSTLSSSVEATIWQSQGDGLCVCVCVWQLQLLCSPWRVQMRARSLPAWSISAEWLSLEATEDCWCKEVERSRARDFFREWRAHNYISAC
jgi:hypothetical protein